MSRELISRNPDLKRLRDDGYDVEVRGNHLVVNNIPYVNSRREVKMGVLVSELTLAGDVTATPSTHVAIWKGELPCNRDGTTITAILHQTGDTRIDQDLVANHSFSNKPRDGYRDYHHKVTTYIAIISNPARSIDPRATAKTFPVFESTAEESVFNYLDTASSRAGIYAITRKLELAQIAIVGLGGTGSYVLDLVAKTPVKEIHLFDGDTFLQHNAFRAPGAPSVDELREKPQKVTYFAAQYAKMRRGIIPHNYFVNEEHVEELRAMDFVFVCVDGGSFKKLVIEKLKEFGKTFIDVGMGLYEADEKLGGILRVTTIVPGQNGNPRYKMSISDEGPVNEYSQNIQVADLNALNAALAVIKWKKLCGFYLDLDSEHYSTYTINGNTLINEDQR